jgi:hypothetical protein
VSHHVIKMLGYIESLDAVGFALLDELAMDVILLSLPPSYESFILKFHMDSYGCDCPHVKGKWT